MKLRPYQEACIKQILTKVGQGVRKQVVVLCTGAGKTVIFSNLPDYVKKSGKKTLVLAHREELLTQARDKIMMISPHLKVEIEQGENTAEPDADVIVASVATLGRVGSRRIKKFDPAHFGLIIIDEAHHSPSESYQLILSYFGANKRDGSSIKGPVLLGVTATPNRSDNVGLDLVFDEMTFKYDIRNGIDDGYLAQIKAFTIFTNENLDDVHTAMGDFQVGELAEAVNTEKRNKLIVDSYKKICDGEIAVVFAANVEHSEELAATFRGAGYTAESVTGETPSEKRKQILEDFKTGKVQVVTNVGVLTEGYDNENIKAVLFARPTKSASLYIQMAGRGLRTAPGKTFVKFLDFVDNMSKHSIISASTLIGLDKPIKADGHNLMDLQESFEQLLANAPNENVTEVDLDGIEARIQEVDIFKMAELPAFITKVSNYAWTPFMEGYKISLGKNEEGVAVGCTIREDLLGKYEVKFLQIESQVPSFKNGFKKAKVTDLHSFSDATLTGAVENADAYIFNNYKKSTGLIDQKAGWRADGPSEKQVKLLKKFGYPNAGELSKGEACNLLSKHFAAQGDKKPSYSKYKKK